MDNSGNELDFKSIFVSYIILITLCIFVVIYVIINFDKIKTGNYYGGDITKSVLLTGIIILLLYLLATWDDVDDIQTSVDNQNEPNQPNQINQQVQSIEIPKFSLADVNKLTYPDRSLQVQQPIQQIAQTGSGSIVPNVVVLPNVTNAPSVINLPNVTTVPNVTTIPNVSTIPNIVNVPNIMGESKYSINNNSMPNNISIPNNSYGNSSIQVKYNNPMTNLSQVKRHIDKLENQNIFVSQKNSLRYGIKF